jgi:Glucose / Sorbosone dehydrogenase
MTAMAMNATHFASLLFALFGIQIAATSDHVTLRVADYATMPVTGTMDGPGNSGSLARVNVLREEPGGTKRFFISDLNGPLYILDTATKKQTEYLNFNGRGTQPGLFDKLTVDAGFANGFITFQFDPDYTRNGKFYTIHLEDPATPGSLVPDNKSVPGLNVSGYAPTSSIPTPGAIQREAVLIEWTDTNIANSTFEGTARELMRIALNYRIHPMGDLIFNPTARQGDADWRVLYIGCGDGGSGEQQNNTVRLNPQRLDTMVGKILRIIPDLQDHTSTSSVSGNGRYRIPNDNPFTAMAGARKEIWAYGLRNPHRLSWDVDPDNPSNNHLIAAVVGLHTWETVDIIHKGANYGYALREGNETLKADNTTGPHTQPDRIPIQITDTTTGGTIAPEYPVLQYPHTRDGGDAIAGGFVYRGKLIPELRGKYLLGDISTGRIWYADYNAMLAAANRSDGNPLTLADMHAVSLLWGVDNKTYASMFPIVETAYHARGGKDPDLPGTSTVSGPGRVDMRLVVDSSGEIYILTKSDGMIRAVVGSTASSARN